ncbi:MAG: extracellular solute-binding protein [Christensenellales bacterium]|jgi:putative aldouronate transport system substrate-binding protein
MKHCSRSKIFLLMVTALLLLPFNMSTIIAKGETKLTEEPITLTLWTELSQKVSNFVTDYNEIKAYQEMEKLTGVHIEFQHPPVGETNQQFNLLVASGQYPDMMYFNWQGVPGGPAKMLDDRVIISLNEAIEKWAPNFKKLLENHPDAAKESMLDDGTIYMFPFFKLEPQARANTGFVYRGDWLDQLGLKEPKTIDEWYAVLTAFKNKDPNGNGEADEIPFVTRSGSADLYAFAASYGILVNFYINQEGKISYGPVQPEYRQYLETMRKWYSEGLIDEEFAISDQAQFDAKMTTNIGGAFYGLLSGNMGRIMNTMLSRQPGFELRGANYPATADGRILSPHAEMAKTVSNGNGVALSTDNENVELSVKWIDYKYSDKGSMLFNFGIEGESYNMIDGYPTYTDLIFRNPDGLTPDQAIGLYATTYGGSMNYDSRYFMQILALPQQKAANELWGQASSELYLPPITATADESAELSYIVNQITTYVDEMFIRFVTGQESLDSFDDYVKNIEGMQLQRAIDLNEAAYQRYLAR